jgi:crotonobetainyl-CoA:carnitine CoA-transferase CaiB-like acyl-CoA transferase
MAISLWLAGMTDSLRPFAVCWHLMKQRLIHSLFASNPERARNRAALTPLLSAQIQKWTKHDILRALETAVVPAGPINTVAEALNDPQIVHRGLQTNPEGVPGLRTPLTFSRSTLSLHRAAPKLL